MTAVQAVGPAEELPPRARRILDRGLLKPLAIGTTSACAENTHVARESHHIPGNYLRVRGEYRPLGQHERRASELPPRARRIHQVENLLGFGIGTTSACAENTDQGSPVLETRGNYLRVRGEYGGPTNRPMIAAELPPRARRIHRVCYLSISGGGTTSACAENTSSNHPGCHRKQNYLRVRGEYGGPTNRPMIAAELPPRARRIHRVCYLSISGGGTTSACAENTSSNHPGCHRKQNYLRVRGEYIDGDVDDERKAELPPRARRIRHDAVGSDHDSGTTSACAENTFEKFLPVHHVGNYLRVRGEYSASSPISR